MTTDTIITMNEWTGWRITRVEDRNGVFLRWEASQKDNRVFACFSDFGEAGDYLGLSAADKARAIKRKAKGTK